MREETKRTENRT